MEQRHARGNTGTGRYHSYTRQCSICTYCGVSPTHDPASIGFEYSTAELSQTCPTDVSGLALSARSNDFAARLTLPKSVAREASPIHPSNKSARIGSKFHKARNHFVPCASALPCLHQPLHSRAPICFALAAVLLLGVIR